MRAAVFGLALVLVVAFFTRWDLWVGSSIRQTTNDAYLQSDTTPIAAQVAGVVRAVPVADFQRVKAGDLLAEIVDADYRAKVAQAEAALNAAIAAIQALDAQKATQRTLIEQAKANVKGLEADAWRTRHEEDRQTELAERGLAGTQQALQQAQAAAQRAAAALEAGRAQIDQQNAILQGLDAQGQEAQATREQRDAELALARINLGYTRITAPADGMVGQRQVRPGQYVGPGSQVITLVPLPRVWIVANYKETQMTRIRIGQPANVRVDAYPDADLHGHVEAYSPASGSQFALLPPENATGNFTKIVQRIPVKIVLDEPNPLEDLLRPGMSVVVTIDTSDAGSRRIAVSDGSAP
ncbi:HlyD family secretion protein [Azospirillum rugosum]|uniref:Membrane fusion protein (Multidrug efflux system) n=1 Tax=Azospirillum rugosum TaxID=416170 RepID=A0ABS4SV96_9PROT|nr:HlyD family secretion protein [Azospirillum rugosum]MBP2296484.1 membrane fusion protein (multidrug efflux system) [Azospirillum rugosum]MDQ0530005.1 membrane fusion protein (multidrug efflux system) [Azospirillum rugosum]